MRGGSVTSDLEQERSVALPGGVELLVILFIVAVLVGGTVGLVLAAVRRASRARGRPPRGTER
jgi:ABC-type antimicrobial peptide transport system permease subunit